MIKFDIKKEKYIKKQPGSFLLYELAMNCYLWLNMLLYLHIYLLRNLVYLSKAPSGILTREWLPPVFPWQNNGPYFTRLIFWSWSKDHTDRLQSLLNKNKGKKKQKTKKLIHRHKGKLLKQKVCTHTAAFSWC